MLIALLSFASFFIGYKNQPVPNFPCRCSSNPRSIMRIMRPKARPDHSSGHSETVRGRPLLEQWRYVLSRLLWRGLRWAWCDGEVSSGPGWLRLSSSSPPFVFSSA